MGKELERVGRLKGDKTNSRVAWNKGTYSRSDFRFIMSQKTPLIIHSFNIGTILDKRVNGN